MSKNHRFLELDVIIENFSSNFFSLTLRKLTPRVVKGCVSDESDVSASLRRELSPPFSRPIAHSTL